LLAIALCAFLFLVGGSIAAVVLLNRQPPASDDETARRQAEEKRLLEEKEKKLEEERKKLAEERKRIKFNQLLAEAEAALAAKDFSKAKKLYTEAMELFPDDASVRAGLIKAETGLALAGKGDEDKEKRQAEYNRLMTLGKDKMEGKEYAAAVTAFEGALQAMNGIDAAASKGLAEAKEALAGDMVQKEKLKEYNTQIETARVAMLAQRYDDAVKAYLAALQAIPGDPLALRGLGDAQKRLGDLADGQKKQNAIAQTLDRARTALAQKRYDVAINAAETVLKLQQGHPEAGQILRDARKAKSEVSVEYTRLMKQADGARALGRITEAFRCYNEALAILPEDEAARRGVNQMRQIMDKMAADQIDYARFMSLGQAALNNKAWLDAKTNFVQALLLAPNDADARAGLKAAEAGLEKYVGKKVALDQAIKAAQAAIQARRYNDALKAASDALAIDPDNVAMLAIQKQARYGVAMANGNAARIARRWSDAIGYYQEALKYNPNDFQARQYLAMCQANLNAKPK
jgi:tetratricopeptide (TPR) repeat protein